VAKIIAERAERALREENIIKGNLSDLIADREARLFDARAELALLQLALDHIKSTVWAADRDLRLQIVANGLMPTIHGGVTWEVGKTVYEIFKSDDPKHPPIAAHLNALEGKTTTLRLEGEFSKMLLHALPMREEEEKSAVIGCIGIMNVVGE